MDNTNGGVDVNATAIDAAIAKLVRHTVWQRKMQPQKRGGNSIGHMWWGNVKKGSLVRKEDGKAGANEIKWTRPIL